MKPMYRQSRQNSDRRGQGAITRTGFGYHGPERLAPTHGAARTLGAGCPQTPGKVPPGTSVATGKHPACARRTGVRILSDRRSPKICIPHNQYDASETNALVLGLGSVAEKGSNTNECPVETCL